MWIRSQDKKQLVNANDLYIATRGKGYCISTGKGNDLGLYSSEDKAMKVLNIIRHEIIEYDKAMFLGCENSSYISCEFEMPEDDEVE